MTRSPTCSTTRTPRAYGAGSNLACLCRPSRPGVWVAFFCVLLLAACAPRENRPEREPTPPVASTCAAACIASCAGTLPRWKGDPDSPHTWDALGDVIAALRERIDACDAARRACLQCLHRLDRAGITCGTAVPCAKERSE